MEGREMATSRGGTGGGLGGVSREGSAKAMVADQICQAVQSTSNLLHLMQNSSPAQVLVHDLFYILIVRFVWFDVMLCIGSILE